MGQGSPAQSPHIKDVLGSGPEGAGEQSSQSQAALPYSLPPGHVLNSSSESFGQTGPRVSWATPVPLRGPAQAQAWEPPVLMTR